MSTSPGTTDRQPAAKKPTMQAVVQERYGSSPEDVLRVSDTARPTPAANEVLVRVRASSVDRGTWHLMAGLPYPARLAFGLRRPNFLNPGRSVAGTVEAVGAEVTGFRPGDEVFGIPGGNGAFAEYVVVRQGKLAAKPANVSFGAAASVPISGTTALQAVRDRGRVRAGEKVLVLGASGGVGSFAVQIAKALGAEVTGVASGAKADLVRSVGADHVVDYTRDDVTDGRARYDVIVDTGGNRRVADLRRALTPAGRLVIVGGETGGRVLGGLQRQFGAALLSPFVGQELGFVVVSEKAEDLDALRELVESGQVTPAVDRTYPLAETAAAIRHVLDGHARGKVVVDVGD